MWDQTFTLTTQLSASETAAAHRGRAGPGGAALGLTVCDVDSDGRVCAVLGTVRTAPKLQIPPSLLFRPRIPYHPFSPAPFHSLPQPCLLSHAGAPFRSLFRSLFARCRSESLLLCSLSRMGAFSFAHIPSRSPLLRTGSLSLAAALSPFRFA
jgi:hypothetical protein